MSSSGTAIVVSISDDRMAAFLSFGLQDLPGLDEVLQVLEAQGIRYGLDRAAIEGALAAHYASIQVGLEKQRRELEKKESGFLQRAERAIEGATVEVVDLEEHLTAAWAPIHTHLEQPPAVFEQVEDLSKIPQLRLIYLQNMHSEFRDALEVLRGQATEAAQSFGAFGQRLAQLAAESGAIASLIGDASDHVQEGAIGWAAYQIGGTCLARFHGAAETLERTARRFSELPGCISELVASLTGALDRLPFSRQAEEWVRDALLLVEQARQAIARTSDARKQLEDALKNLPALQATAKDAATLAPKLAEEQAAIAAREGRLSEVRTQLPEGTAPAPPAKGASTVIARGLAPLPGTPMRVECSFNAERKIELRVAPDGRVDHHNLGLLETIEPGEELGRVFPEIPGTPGSDVFGQELPPPPMPQPRYMAGKGVQEREEEGVRLFEALEGGQPVFANNTFSVHQELLLQGDVDLTTGDIVFLGNVNITGTLKKGFKVRCEGDVSVQGFIEGGVVEATGAVVVKGGIRGGGQITAGTSLDAFFIENSNVFCKGDAHILQNVIQSQLTVEGNLLVDNALIGGQIFVCGTLQAKAIGSRAGTATGLVLSPGEYWAKALAAKEKELQLLTEMGEAGTPEQQAMFRVLEEAIAQIKERLANPGIPRVRATEAMYPGVLIRMDRGLYRSDAQHPAVSFKLGEGHRLLPDYV